jgi:hypothetical protein
MPGPRAGYDYHLPDAEVIEEMEKLESAKSQNDRAKKVNWLSESLANEAVNAWPEDGDIITGTHPVADTDKLAAAIEKLFLPGRYFYNIYQAEQFLAKFSSQWGFQPKCRGWNLCCAYTFEDRSKEYTNMNTKNPQVPPNRKRKKLEPIAAAVCCPFRIHFSSYDKWEKGKSKRWSTPVKVGKVVSQHTCKPGPESQTLAKSASGHYTKSITDEAYERLLVMLDDTGGTSVTCDTIRQLMRPFIPNGVVITASDVHNMRVRAKRIRLEGRTLNGDEKRNFISNPGLDWTAGEVGVDTENGRTPAMAADSEACSATTGKDGDNNFPMDDVEDDDDNRSPADLNRRELMDFTSEVSNKEMAQKCIELVDAGSELDPHRKRLLFGSICEILSAVRDETGIYRPSA